MALIEGRAESIQTEFGTEAVQDKVKVDLTQFRFKVGVKFDLK